MAGTLVGPETVDLSGPGLSRLPEFRWRVLTPWGVELAYDLPHLSSHYTVNGMLRGIWPPTATIGPGSINLIPPRAFRSESVRSLWLQDFAAVYAQLDEMLRVECYDRHGAPGDDPLWTGLVTKRPKKTSAYSLDCQDSLMLLQKAKTERNDYILDTAFAIASQAIRDWKPWYADDFSDAGFQQRYPADTNIAGARMDYLPSPTAYVGHGTAWTHTVAGGRGFASCNPGAGNSMLCTGATVQATTTPQKLDAKFHVVAPAATASFEAGLVFGRDDSLNKHFRAVVCIDTRPGVGEPYVVTVKLLYSLTGLDEAAPAHLFPDITWSAGKIAVDGTVTLDFQLGVWVNERGVRVSMNGTAIGGGDIILDGSSGVAGAHVADTVGSTGLFARSTGAGTVNARDLYCFTMVPQFTLHMTPGTTLYEHDFNQTTRLEQLMIAAFAEDLDLYKQPKAGMDEIWTGTPPALDGGTPPLFTVATYDGAGHPTDPGNIVDNTASEDPNTNKFATEVAVTGQGSGGSGPIITARNLEAIRKYGMWNLQQSLVDVRDIETHIRAADITVDVASSPEQARSLTVLDKPGRTKGQWREQSTARFNVPDLGADMTDALRVIVGYDRVENSDLRTLRLDNFSSKMALPEMQRIRSELDNLMGLSLQYLPPPPGTAGMAYDPTGLPVIYNDAGVPTFGFDPITRLPLVGDGVTGLAPLSASAGGVNLLGTGVVSASSLAIAAGAQVILSQVPFTVTGHAIYALVIALFRLLTTSAGTEAGDLLMLEMRVGTDTSHTSEVSNVDAIEIASGLQKSTLIVPDTTPLDPGDYVAYIMATNASAYDMVVTQAAGQFQIYCV